MTNTNNAHTSAEMAEIIIMVQNAIRQDEQNILNWEAGRKKERKKWESLTLQEQQKRRALGMEYTDAQINTVQLRNATRAVRRKLRYKIFRIRDCVAANTLQEDKGLLSLASWYEKQFRSGWHFRNFTFDWDISAIDPLKIISPFEWDGEVQDQTLRVEDGTHVRGKFCDPTAFTNQEM